MMPLARATYLERTSDFFLGVRKKMAGEFLVPRWTSEFKGK